MANELALRLETDIEKLVPKLIAWNNTELLTEVKLRLEEYRGRVYDDSSIATAKKDRAVLNKFTTALNSERLRVKKIYIEPLDKFTGEVNEVIATVNEVMAEIDVQVKTYETARKEEKLAECKAYYAEILPADLAAFVAYEKVHKDEWLNASKKLSAVQKDIDAAVAKIKAEIITIEALGGDTTELKAMYFENLSLTDTITAYERRKAEKQRIESAKAEADKLAEEEKKTAPAPVQAEETVQELYTIAFKVTGTAEQLNALKAYMRENHLKIERV